LTTAAIGTATGRIAATAAVASKAAALLGVVQWLLRLSNLPREEEQKHKPGETHYEHRVEKPGSWRAEYAWEEDPVSVVTTFAHLCGGPPLRSCPTT
jgi:hypothetical protein